jgi:hypothetical protein
MLRPSQIEMNAEEERKRRDWFFVGKFKGKALTIRFMLKI